ncbi:hypothetical protein P4O66_013325, partial [Electrophorus voltai]
MSCVSSPARDRQETNHRHWLLISGGLMSGGRESVGDLVPQDVLEVLSQEHQTRTGKRRRRGSFSRAFNWLKGRRRKSHRSSKDAYKDLLTPGTPVPLPLLLVTAVHKEEGLDHRPLQHFQENVFIESSRPSHIEDLHTEAQQGLKLLQQDENKNGVDYQDDQSVISTATSRTNDDMSFSELAMSESESTAADTISTRSTISYQSTRSGLKRQASTFRPLNEDKKQGKSKSKRKNRSTVVGIPRHVQKELGLDRAAWTASRFTDAQLSNGGVIISAVIPTLDGISITSDQEQAQMCLGNKENLQTVIEDEPQLPSRPASLAVPWMTSSDGLPPSPVISSTPRVASPGEDTGGSPNMVRHVPPKPTQSRKAPPPPNRSHSLHKRHSRDLLDAARIVAEESMDPYVGGLSSLGKASQHKEKSPPISAARQGELGIKKGIYAARANLPLPYTNGGSLTNGMVVSPAAMAVRALFDVPAPPKVLAPPPPPPETWAHNQRTFELLCGPGPVNFECWAQKRGLKMEPPNKKAPEKVPQMNSAKGLNGKTVPSAALMSCPSDRSKETFQGSQLTNGITNILLQSSKNLLPYSQEAMALDRESRTAPTEKSSELQAPYGNNLSIPGHTQLHPFPSPSPPPEHLPPLPPGSPAKPPKDDVASKAQLRKPSDADISPPPHPLFPPPPPPVKVPRPLSPVEQDELDFPPPPSPFSSKSFLTVIPDTECSPSLEPSTLPDPPHVPPPPPQVPMPPPHVPPPPPLVTPPLQLALPPPQVFLPPPQVAPPHPQEPPPLSQEVTKIPPPPQQKSLIQTHIAVTPVNVPLPPPLPTHLKKESREITTVKQDKRQLPQATHAVATKEEAASPVVTQSLLQMVRLRSVKSSVSQAEISPKSKSQNTSVSQEAPPKPVRRSLILVAPPPDVASLSVTESIADSRPITMQENQGATPASNSQPIAEIEMQCTSAVQDAAHVLETKPLSISTDANSQTIVTEQKPQHTSTESKDESVSARLTSQLPSKETKPEITVQGIQNEASIQLTQITIAEPKDQPATADENIKTSEEEIQKGPSESDDKPKNTQLISPLDVTQQKPPTLTPTTPKISPTQKLPPAPVPCSSMRLQEAIRLKTAAMSSIDNQAKRLSLHSPPPSAGGNSPSSTANFIFSKSTKKVVVGAPSSPGAHTGLMKTLVSELATFSQPNKPANSPIKTVKVPPPIAKKPKAW